MKEAAKKVAYLIAFLVFITIFMVTYRFNEPFSMELMLPVILKALIGAVLFGIGGLIIGDIVIKGVIEDIDNDKLEPLEGGFEQRIHDFKKRQRVSIVERELRFGTGKKNKNKK